MRQIKFRAWNLTEKAWTSFATCIDSGAFAAGGVLLPFRDVVIMQSTGLLDKNGKEVWEGDIVKYIDCCAEERVNQVEWIDDDAGFSTFGADYGCGDAVGREHEVIGNIYENPELLA